MASVHAVFFGKRGNWSPAGIFLHFGTARAFVSEKTGIPVEQLAKKPGAKSRTYRIREVRGLDEVVVGWVIGSTDPSVEFGDYLEWAKAYDEAATIADAYPGGTIRRETYSEAAHREKVAAK